VKRTDDGRILPNATLARSIQDDRRPKSSAAMNDTLTVDTVADGDGSRCLERPWRNSS
jgi:hypothetical protein